jgi:UDP-N-acetylglucosamine--N-acetylmuramyl-(pentapeptide) pyrophosphoryl-undecaprenol N-acetylglucosamine transferase
VTRPVVLTGGGTGGHVLPLRAIAAALIGAGVDADDLVIVGSRRGQDKDLLEGVGIEQVLLPGRGIRRSLDVRATLRNLAALAGLAAALVRGVALVARRRPRAVVSVGGYAAFAAAVGAVVTGRPLVLVDLDASPGLVHRVLGPFAVAIAAAYPGDGGRRVVVTGTPLRAEIIAVTRSLAERDAARSRLGLDPGRAVVAITSGSLGASSINRAVCELALRWGDRGPATLYHVTGRRDAGEVRTSKAAAGIDDASWRLVEFELAMQDVWSACDVAVSRAGATTVAEICAAGVPSVLVALPGAPGDHQARNAAVLARSGAAVVLDDAAVSGALLDEVLTELLGDPGRLEAMSRAARSLARPDAAQRIAEVVLDHAR